MSGKAQRHHVRHRDKHTPAPRHTPPADRDAPERRSQNIRWTFAVGLAVGGVLALATAFLGSGEADSFPSALLFGPIALMLVLTSATQLAVTVTILVGGPLLYGVYAVLPRLARSSNWLWYVIGLHVMATAAVLALAGGGPPSPVVG